MSKIQITARFACLFITLPAHSSSAVDEQRAQMGVQMWQQSTAWLGRPYRLSPLGEGAPPDADPRATQEAFDCVTLVESAIAAACAGSLSVQALDAIRYSGSPSFAARRHLTEFQWIPALVDAGILRPVSQIGSGQHLRQAVQRTYSLHKSQFQTPIGQALVRSGLQSFEKTVQLQTYGIENLIGTAFSSPLIAILFVNDAHLGVTRVKHMGLLAQQGERLILRHASSRTKRVLDEDWTRVVNRQQRHPRGVRHVALYELIGCPQVGK